ncbi:hypothetical protein MPSEU_000592700 [Mayamaea pseudoterrestris]|nr:hypothetical protein MPSEU_000592700 [Mayamaea pseudoterrestris]
MHRRVMLSQRFQSSCAEAWLRLLRWRHSFGAAALLVNGGGTGSDAAPNECVTESSFLRRFIVGGMLDATLHGLVHMARKYFFGFGLGGSLGMSIVFGLS